MTPVAAPAPGRPRRRRGGGPLPGFAPTLGFTLVYLAGLVVLPLAALALRPWEHGLADVARTLTDARTLAALRLSFGCAALAAVTDSIAGLLIAWALVRYRFPGRALLDLLVDLPFALPTAVAGIALSAVYAPNGWIGAGLASLGIKVAYTPAGVFVAMAFVGLPFAVRSVQPVLQDLDPEVEEAAETLGAGALRRFRSVVLPTLAPAITAGFALAFARAVGEYGSVIFIAGNLPFKSEIAPLLIVGKLEAYDYAGAATLGLAMLLGAGAALLLLNLAQLAAARRGLGVAEARSSRAAAPPGAAGAPIVAGAFAWLLLIVGTPLAAVFVEALRKGFPAAAAALAAPDTVSAIKLTLLLAAIVVPLNTAFGLAAAWAIAKFEFRGKGVLVTLLDLPLSVSPVVSGLVWVLLFGAQGWLGPWLMDHGVRVIFALPGMVLATLFVTLPLVARELLPLMQAQGSDEEAAAATLGAGGLATFLRVTLPNVRWALLTGVLLCAARAMGEFGAVSVVSGHVRGRTDTLPLHIEALHDDYDFTGAFACASLLAGLAVVTLLLRTLMERRSHAADATVGGAA